MALNKQKMDVGELLCDVAERYAGVAAEKGFGIATDVPENCPAAYSNPDRTEQALIAFLDNAIKYNEGVFDIRLCARDAGERLVISVSNAGAIDEGDIAHIFERFYKADRAHAGEGTGLGLSISKEIMDLLGERIWAQSENGAVTFSFTLAKYSTDVEK